MSKVVAPTLTLLAVTLATPSMARAYSELARFAEPALDGGGEGRYFTGAPPDGLGCTVCHDGGATPVVTIAGLPDAIAVGTRYTLSLSWPDDGRRYALALELVDGAGQHPGVALPTTAEQSAAMRCAEPLGSAAASTLDVGGRRIVAVAPCGARALTVGFTPTVDQPLYLGLGLVASDQHEDVAHDGVLELRRTLTTNPGGCSAGGRAPSALVALTALGLLVRPRRRAARCAIRR